MTGLEPCHELVLLRRRDGDELCALLAAELASFGVICDVCQFVARAEACFPILRTRTMRYFADATEPVVLRDIAPSSLPRIGPGREAIRGRHEVEDDRPERNDEAGQRN